MTQDQIGDWEVVKSDGTIKRYPVPGGWIYGVWEWRQPTEFIGDWYMINAFFIADDTPPPGQMPRL